MAKIRFEVRSKSKNKLAKVYLRYYDGRNLDFRLPTLFLLVPEYWDNKGQSFSSQKKYSSIFTKDNATDLEKKFNDLKGKILTQRIAGVEITLENLIQIIYDFHHPTKKKNRYTLTKYISDFISDMSSGNRLTEKSTRFNPGTTKNYREFERRFEDYTRARRKVLNFEDITMDFYDDFIKYFRGKDQSINTIGKQIKILKRIMRASYEEKLHQNDQFQLRKFKVLTEESNSIYLNLDEIQRMYDLDLSENKPMEEARDIFLIGCFTALRYSDYKRISPDHIQKTPSGTRIVKIKTLKMGIDVIIPFWHWMLDELINKYPDGLPKSYEQKINSRIKKIGKLAKIDTPENKTSYKDGNRFDTTTPKYNLIMTHTARRSGATNMYKHDIPTIDIMKITGHSKESTFMKYIKQSKEEAADRIGKEFRINKPLKAVK